MYPFRDGSFAVRNGWYVAAFASEVTRSLLGLSRSEGRLLSLLSPGRDMRVCSQDRR